jgi:acyl transferase domain-containing protein
VSEPVEPRYDGSEIAVVGMAGRFPGAPDLDAFWRNLRNGVESIRFFTDAELLDAGVDPERIKDPAYVKARPILDGVDLFDAAFFGLNPREAEILDPQHRVFLECAWEALEHAGYDTSRFKGAVSLFAGASFSNYLVHNLYKNRPVMESFGDLLTTIYNVPDSLTTMVGYKLDLKGACCAVQTFCSSSLVAVHLAGQSLLNYETDVALAGGVTVYVPQTSGYLHEEGSIVSRDGHCRAFDARADGTVFGNGVGIVVLRRLEDALRDGDTVHAVILGSAVNNDGTRKVSFAAPGVVGQTEVVVEALAAAEVDPATIGYVEAHGTGTRLGDPAEVSALTKAFGTRTDRKGFCALGSVKTNVGHLDAAAGVSGLIKVILALEHREIPPSLHFETPNPDIDFLSSPFFVNTNLRDWAAGGSPRRAAVSAFGVGGTNAHLVVEEAPAQAKAPSGRAWQLLVLSAKSESALERGTANLADHLDAHPDLDLADVAWTLQAGRRAFAHRRVAVCRGALDAAAVLQGREQGRLLTRVGERRNPPVVLVFPSGGTVSEAALRELCAAEPSVAREIERGLAASGAGAADLRCTLVQYALGRVLLSWGIRPEALVAEGSGESAARALTGEAVIPIVSRSSLPADDARLFVELRPDLSSAGLLEALGALWLGGVEVDWAAVHAPERRRRVPLPAYPFERRRFWVEPLPDEPASPAPSAEPRDWLYRPCWKTALPAVPPSGRGLRHLLFLDGTGLGAALAERLEALGDEVVTVEPAALFAGEPATGYRLDPRQPEHYDALWDDLVRRGQRPGSVVHLWSADPGPADDAHERFEDASLRGFDSILHLARAAVREGGQGIALRVVAAGLHEVLGGEALCPEKAPLLALLRVLAQEHEGLRCASVDVELPPRDDLASLVEALAAEVRSTSADTVVALRRGRRWVQVFERLEGREGDRSRPAVREGGTYLVTGGLGHVGFALAVGLARAARVKLVLTGRSSLPPREEWDRWLETHEPSEPTALRIRRVRALESVGSEVLPLAADVADERAMTEVVAAVRKRFGAFHGVIHAAGDLGEETFRAARDLPPEACARQFRPKVHGLLVLDRLLGREPLDFWLLTSSLSTVLGGYGYAAYAGANAFLDAFAALRAREGGAPWLSVDWDQWDFPGVVPARRPAAASGLRPEQGVAVLDRALGLLDLDRLVVSVAPLEARLRRWVRLEDSPAPEGTKHAIARDEDADVLAGIERTLLAHEAVTAAVVLSRENGHAGEPPVAYVVFGTSFGPTVTELRSWLKERLPAERVPSSFVVLDALPLAPDGTVDRRRLARLDAAEPEGTAGSVGPRTAMEALVADTWREALGLERVSVHDNFFNLGGHSLLAVRVIGRIEKAIGLRLDPRDLIFQTLEQLAAACDERSRAVGGRV